MLYKNLGQSGLEISVFSLGSWLTIGAALDNAASQKIMETAIEVGINFFDTANVYNTGEAELAIGKFLENYERKHILIGTKVFFPMGTHPLDKGLSLRNIRNSCFESLERLGTEYIDLYQCHRYDTKVPLEEVCYAMHSLIEEGCMNYWGVSQWSAVQITNAMRICEKHQWMKPISNQPIYNMLNRSLEVDVMETCEKENMGIIVYSPLAQGILSGKYTSTENLPENSRATNPASEKWFSFKRLTEENLAKISQLQVIAKNLDCTLSQLALAWCLRQPAVTGIITGVSSTVQLSENIDALNISISQAQNQEIEEILGNAPVDQYTGNRIGYGVPPTL